MIVPRNRLLWVTALFLPFLILEATGGTGGVTLMLGALLALMAVGDVLLSRDQLLGIRVQTPDIIRISRETRGNISLLIENKKSLLKNLRLGLALPDSFENTQEELNLVLPEGATHSRAEWICTPRERGSYRLDRCHLETPSLLGLWNMRRQVPLESRIHVHPNLQKERKQLASLFLHRGNFGVHARRMMGQGREFEKLRDYLSGDSFDQIHWKATAKRNHPVTKVFQIERTQEVYAVIDFSRLSLRKQGKDTNLERFITAALMLGLAAEEQGDLFGLITFSDQVRHFIRARNGSAHYHTCRDAIFALQPQVVPPQYDEVCSFIRMNLRRRALLVFLSDLDDPELMENALRNLGLICRQHLILMVSLQSPEIRPLFDKRTVGSTDEIYQRLGGHMIWHRLQEMQKTLGNMGIRLLQVENERLSSETVGQYLKVRERQLL